MYKIFGRIIQIVPLPTSPLSLTSSAACRISTLPAYKYFSRCQDYKNQKQLFGINCEVKEKSYCYIIVVARYTTVLNLILNYIITCAGSPITKLFNGRWVRFNNAIKILYVNASVMGRKQMRF